MIRKFGQRAAAAAAVAAVAASGTVLFGATALADGIQHGSNHLTGGDGGKGGTAQSWCLIPIAGGLGILGSGSADGNDQCNAGTSGGSAGSGASY